MSYLAEESLDPVTLRRVFLLATRQLFSDPENYGSLRARLDRYVYSEDLKTSTLPVELDFEYNAVELQPRHAIYVGVGDIGFSSQVLDHRADISEDRAKVTYTQAASTALRLRCVAPVADEPLYLATVASAYYMAMSRVFMVNLGLSRFDLATLSAPQLVDKAPTRMFEVQFAAKLDFHFNIVSTLEGQRLKTFQLTTLPLTP
jgi:hypothetical protein